MSFGHYDPTDCTNQKVVHGSNCSLICDPGFEVKGPAVKTCGGKKSGIWSNRSKLPKCIGMYYRFKAVDKTSKKTCETFSISFEMNHSKKKRGKKLQYALPNIFRCNASDISLSARFLRSND